MKNLIMLMMLTIVFSSCRNPDGYPRIDDIEQLSPFFVYIEIDGKQYIDVEESKCLSRVYRHTKGYIGAVRENLNLHISECNKVIGYSPREYGYYTTWKENMRHWMINAQN